MSLLDPPVFDERKARRRRNLAITIALAVMAVIVVLLIWPYYMAHQTVDHFMDALVRRNYQEAYAIWHPNPKSYPMDTFMQDWGPGSRWGIIKTYRIDRVITPPKMAGGPASGLIALVQVNGITDDEERLYVMKDHGQRILGFYPY